MKVLYIKLTDGYKEGLTYQENTLPAKFVELGYETYLFASGRARNDAGERIYISPKEYTNDKGVHVQILPVSKHFKRLSNKFDRYDVLFDKITEIAPDIIFVHGIQCMGALDAAKYKRMNPETRLIVDNHADYNIMPLNTLKRKVAQKLVYKSIARKICNDVDVFFGVSPWRAQYLHEVYGIPESKIKVIKQGGDEAIIKKIDPAIIRKTLQDKYKISPQSKLIVSGAGNMDVKKNIHELLAAVTKVDGYDLILFGKFTTEEKELCEKYLGDSRIHYIGQIPGVKTYELFCAADLAVFPGQHSVMWDQVVACGIPVILKYWKDMDYFDINGNCIYLHDGNSEEIKGVLEDLSKDNRLDDLKRIAGGKSKKEFSYIEIARGILECV